MSVRLTETERRVAELYTRGMRPREIAERLGISINTVYKALSKARRATELDGQPVAPAPSYFSYTAVVYVYPNAQQMGKATLVTASAVVIRDMYDVVLKKLDEIISLLKNTGMAERPGGPKAEVVGHREGGHVGNGHKDGGHLPEALRRNVWISLLRNKAT